MLEACAVRALTDLDLHMVLAWRNNPAVRSYMLNQHEISLQEHYNWYARVKQDSSSHQLLVLEGTEPIGFIQFSRITEAGVADWGFYLKPDAPKGSGRKLGQAALKHAFVGLGLQKVCGQVIESNRASISFHQKMGFIEEGRLIDQHHIGNQFRMLLCFGLLAKDWLKRQ